MIAVAWLCFLLATLPCLSMAAGACCPTANDDAGTQTSQERSPATPVLASHGDPHDDSLASAAGSHPCASDTLAASDVPVVATDTMAADCPVLTADGCCDAPTPTLEDRSPKVPAKLAATVPTAVLILDDSAVAMPPATRPATGPPPGRWDASPVHLELCTFLI